MSITDSWVSLQFLSVQCQFNEQILHKKTIEAQIPSQVWLGLGPGQTGHPLASYGWGSLDGGH